MTPTIRPARTGDAVEVARLHDICLRTGDGGGDASGLYGEPRLLGEVYLGAYLALAPDLAFVLDDEEGEPVGYVIGAHDSLSFDDDCEASWWPPLRRRYPRGSFAPGSPDARLVGLIHEPHRTDPAIAVDYPAHLHVDVLPRGQGLGQGRHLLETLFDALRSKGARGVHLGVAAENAHAIGFYRHLGFTELRGDEYSLTLGLRL